jgi:hypothetical protein
MEMIEKYNILKKCFGVSKFTGLELTRTEDIVDRVICDNSGLHSVLCSIPGWITVGFSSMKIAKVVYDSYLPIKMLNIDDKQTGYYIYQKKLMYNEKWDQFR